MIFYLPGDIWRHLDTFLLSQLGGCCYWPQTCSGPGCCWTFRNAQDSSINRILWPKMLVVPLLRSSTLRTAVYIANFPPFICNTWCKLWNCLLLTGWLPCAFTSSCTENLTRPCPAFAFSSHTRFKEFCVLHSRNSSFPNGIIFLHLETFFSIFLRSSDDNTSSKFYLSSENAFILLSFLEDLFVGYRILGWAFFPFST